MNEALLLLAALVVKHFVCDFPLQRWPYMYTNKGTYGHFGGLLHALVHWAGTLVVLIMLTPLTAMSSVLAAADFLIHYHVDWAKMRLCAHYNLKPNNSEWYWHLLGLDQLLHYLTYIGITYYALR